jgi:hypothetical protein
LTDTIPSGHTDFDESTEEIAPLTEEEKKAKLAELREKLKQKKAGMSDADKEDTKRNEVRLPCLPTYLPTNLGNPFSLRQRY